MRFWAIRRQDEDSMRYRYYVEQTALKPHQYKAGFGSQPMAYGGPYKTLDEAMSVLIQFGRR